MSAHDMAQAVYAAAAEAGLPLAREQAETIGRFHELLCEANARFNLTRVPDDIREACDRNYVDSLTGIPYIVGARAAADVGSGAGFPGMPLAIACPDITFTLIEAQGKRAAFLEDAKEKLGLSNVKVLCCRAEDAGRGKLRGCFDIALARAVAPLGVLAEYLLPLVRQGGCMLAYKGPQAAEEAEQAAGAFALLGGGECEILDANVPGRDWKHTIVRVVRTGDVPDKYPRRAGVPEKKPL